MKGGDGTEKGESRQGVNKVSTETTARKWQKKKSLRDDRW